MLEGAVAVPDTLHDDVLARQRPGCDDRAIQPL